MQSPTTPVTPLEDAILARRIDQDESKVERLLQAIEAHIRGEADALVEYERLAQVSQHPAVELVMRLILDDEQRHHALLGRIATSLHDALYWTRSADALPASPPQEPLAAELAILARTLIKEEQNGARALRELAVRERGVDGGLDSLLLEMRALDSEKHARLLQFVEPRLVRASHA